MKMNKATVNVYRSNETMNIHIYIVDRINKQSIDLELTAKEYGLMLTGLVNTDNCNIKMRELK